MASIARLMRSLWGPSLRTRPFPVKPPAMLSPEDLIEEERLPRYCPQRYYPVRLGETFNDRYLVVSKLGYGASSTVWLARDFQTRWWWWQANPFVTLKILTNDLVEKSAAGSELEISRRIAATDPKSRGSQFLRTVLSSFEVAGPDATHVGLVYAPMRESISKLQRRTLDGRIPGYLLKPLLEMLLTGLDHLHTKCHIIHTDLKPDIILLGIENQAVIEEVAKTEAEEPTPQKMQGGRTIYPSRNFGDFQAPPGPPKIADFGLAVRGDVPQPHNHPIQAELLQAPEVIFEAGWTYSADIWNLGVMLWDLLENRTLFDAFDPIEGAYSPEVHLLEMTALLGPCPTKLLQRGEKATHYFTSEGELRRQSSDRAKASDASSSSFESGLTSLTGEDKRLFLSFVRRMLRWMPEDRATAGELLQDPYLSI